MMPNDLPPWHSVQQQAQRWIRAGCFEAMAQDLRKVLVVLRRLSGSGLRLSDENVRVHIWAGHSGTLPHLHTYFREWYPGCMVCVNVHPPIARPDFKPPSFADLK